MLGIRSLIDLGAIREKETGLKDAENRLPRELEQAQAALKSSQVGCPRTHGGPQQTIPQLLRVGSDLCRLPATHNSRIS